jgi:quaternary ammonium compound-resistance protein SugE
MLEFINIKIGKRMSPWIFLLLSGLFEIGWMISLKQTNGFTRIVPIIFYALFGGGSALFLYLAMRSIPASIAYAIWIGVAIIGTTIVGMLYFNEPYKINKVVCITFIIIGIIGLKFS